jgi:hypothetical protein
MKKKKIKEIRINRNIIKETRTKRSDLNLQNFFYDMDLLGRQVSDKNIKKPSFYYADLTTTNYLLWLILGELRILNESFEGK